MASVLREQVHAVDPDLPLFEVMPLDDLLAASDERIGQRVFGTMFVVFAFVALLLRPSDATRLPFDVTGSFTDDELIGIVQSSGPGHGLPTAMSNQIARSIS